LSIAEDDVCDFFVEHSSSNLYGPQVLLKPFLVEADHETVGDRYGHLMPGSEAEAAQLLDTYMNAQRERAEDEAREAVAA
jgi:hypothetical protein